MLKNDYRRNDRAPHYHSPVAEFKLFIAAAEQIQFSIRRRIPLNVWKWRKKIENSFRLKLGFCCNWQRLNWREKMLLSFIFYLLFVISCANAGFGAGSFGSHSPDNCKLNILGYLSTRPIGQLEVVQNWHFWRVGFWQVDEAPSSPGPYSALTT